MLVGVFGRQCEVVIECFWSFFGMGSVIIVVFLWGVWVLSGLESVYGGLMRFVWGEGQ